ncbi:MAG: SDR family NAD(P)-dependent oxidoreductase [Pirellulaceae bacterium]
MELDMHGKVAIVTGGSRGLGRSVSRRLAAEGAQVVVNFRDHAEQAAAVVESIEREAIGSAIPVSGDVSCESDVVRLFDEAERRFGTVDVLVNNAAICPTCLLKDMTLDMWSQTLEVNLTGAFLTCREMVRRLLAADRPGRIVNVASSAAFLGSTTGHAPYDASKGALVSLTVSLAREVAAHGIAVNAVAPGMIYTDMTGDTLRANEAKYLSRIPLQRIADPDEIADVILFLASSRASYMTGATVNVSGGLLMR